MRLKKVIIPEISRMKAKAIVNIPISEVTMDGTFVIVVIEHVQVVHFNIYNFYRKVCIILTQHD